MSFSSGADDPSRHGLPRQQIPDGDRCCGMAKAARKKASSRRGGRKWSAKVTRESHALDLDKGLFTRRNAHDIAKSLKRSAERSHARKASPLRSALSMLTFYINRAGSGLSIPRRKTLEAAKDELRKLFGKKTSAAHH